MAEAIAAFGLAAGVIQMIDVSARILSSGWKLLRSRNDEHTIDEIFPIEAAAGLASDLKSALDGLQTSQPNGNAGNRTTALGRLVGDCEQVLNEQLKQLERWQELAVGGKRDRLKLAIATCWHKNKMEELEDRLSSFKQQLSIQLLVSLRDYASASEMQQAEALRQIEENTLRQRELKETLGKVLEETAPVGPSVLKALSVEAEGQVGILDELQENIIHYIFRDDEDTEYLRASEPTFNISERRRKSIEKMTLSSLHFDGMTFREKQVIEAHQSTFRWIFAPNGGHSHAWSDFAAWLESDESLYWITGKAGSGKSTLMKFISSYSPNDHLLYKEHLSTWAGNCPVAFASFYAWYAGTQLQMTQAGLFRTLIYQLLKQHPELIPVVYPAHWEAFLLFGSTAGKLPGLYQAETLKACVTEISKSSKVFLMIDGLDEFSGDHEELSCLVLDLITLPNVKMCVSSRPWVDFEDAFSSKPSLTLQHLTYPDIKAYVTSRFGGARGFVRLRQREPEYADQLIEDVVKKSAGVFLWVALVVQSLLKGLKNDDRVIDLQARLDELPEDLDKLFERIMQSLEPIYLEHAKQYFDIMEAHQNIGPLTALVLSLTDEVCPDFVLKQPIRTFKNTDILNRISTISRRLSSRCRGLLEVYSMEENGEVQHTVQYLHRTVAEYLKSPQARNILSSEAFRPPDAHLLLCASYLSSIKGISNKHLLGKEFSQLVTRCLSFARKPSQCSNPAVTSLLDELDITGRALAKSAASISPHMRSEEKIALESGNWVLLFPPSFRFQRNSLGDQHCFGRTFLSLIIKYEITNYVKIRANRGCLVERIGDYAHGIGSIVWPLLADAVFLWDDLKLNEDIVSELLNHGAKPDFRTTWKAVMRHSPYELAKMIRTPASRRVVYEMEKCRHNGE